MISYNFLQYLMNDPFTLSHYLGKNKNKLLGRFRCETGLNNLEKLQKNWIQCSHLEDSSIPDHICNNWNKELVQGSGDFKKLTLKDVFLKLLPKSTEDIFCLDGNLIVVKEGQLDYWQHISKSFSPLVLEVAFLWLKLSNIEEVKQAINDNFANTAIPSHQFIKSWNAEVADVHVHFNSGLETDYKWVVAVNNPDAFIKYSKAVNRFDDCLGESIIKNYDSMAEMLLEAAVYLEEVEKGMSRLDSQYSFNSKLASHAWIIYNRFQKLNEFGCKPFEFNRFHQYLLIVGAFRQLYVMQHHQVGLEQFNHMLHQPFKGPYDAQGEAQQLMRQQVNNNIFFKVKQIEFRIGADKLKNIVNYREGFKQQNSSVEVVFICSLLKSADDITKVLENDFDKIKNYVDDIVGIDVAGKDYNAPPSAFKDMFAKIRSIPKNQSWRFTYHAGEDFFHILTGMRMIYEAVKELNLHSNDRIGHASAAGVDPRNWFRCIHGVVPIKQGEYLDDLRFVLNFIKERNIVELEAKRKSIKDYLTKKSSISKEDLDRIIKVDSFQFFEEEELRILQKRLLSYLAEKGIVIEACPTSNVCIGYDHSLKSYHLKTWLRWKYIDHLEIPDIVIGSDEIGVFPTNISNEYACVYEMLMMDKNLKGKAKDILDDLARNSMKYSFIR